MNARMAILVNALGLYAVALVLLLGFVFQLAWHELPCPLCLLQRIAFLALAVGPILNIRYGPRPSHYAMSVLAALVGVAVSIRQVLLHILPHNPGYGSAIAGLHYYSWAALFFALAILLVALVLLFDRQFEPAPPPQPPLFAVVAVVLVIIVAAANAASTLLECGFTWCPEDPTRYILLLGGG
jgi:disulfide bond formation protein DsbB